MKRLTISVLGGLALCILLALFTPKPVQGLAGISKIAFTSERDRNREVYVMNPDGSNPVNLTKNPADDYQPTWSPNADRIAFVSTRDGNPEICVMSADGSGQTCITSNPTANHKPDKTLPKDQFPSWSPDGLHIAFSSTHDGNSQIDVIEPGGGALANLSNNGSNEDQPAWSPDLRSIAFTSDRDGNTEICVMDASGYNQRCLTNHKTKDGKHDASKPSDSFPAWSPDSQHLAFLTTQGSRTDLYVMSADGSNPQLLVKNVFPAEHPAWSPDGKTLAYVAVGKGKAEISEVGTDGKNPVGLTAPGTANFAPAWQPLPPPPGSTATPTLTDTPTPTPQPPSPTPGGTSLLLGEQDICALKDGLTVSVPLKFFEVNGSTLVSGYTPGTLIATPGVKITATSTLGGYGIVDSVFVTEEMANKLGVVAPTRDLDKLAAQGVIGPTGQGGVIGNGSTYTESYTFTEPARFRIYVFGGVQDKSASISVHITCSLATSTPGATVAATDQATAASARTKAVSPTPSSTPAKSSMAG